MHADLQKNISTLLKIAVLWLKCMQALPTTSIDDPLPVVNDDEPLADFTGHKLVRIRQFDRNQETFLDQLTCDVWGEDEESAEALVHLTPEQYKVILEEPTTFPNITVVSHNLQEMIDIEAMRHQNAKTSKDPANWFNAYHPYIDIKQWFERLAASSRQNPSGTIVRLVRSIGKSAENRDIFAVHFTAPRSPVLADGVVLRKPKQKVWIQCLIHSREWISGSVCQYIAQQLVEKSDPRTYRLLDDAQIIMVPVVNPDGYVFSWTRNRLWRKNRRGPGVDLNRNFADHWGMVGSSAKASHEMYCGPKAESEPETKAIRNYFLSLGNVTAAIDWHSYSQIVLRPYGWTLQPSPHERLLKMASELMVQAMQQVNKRYYVPKRAAELYENSGSAADWFYSVGTRYTLTVELPPRANGQGDFGFVWSPERITPVCEEAWEGFVTYLNFALYNPLR